MFDNYTPLNDTPVTVVIESMGIHYFVFGESFGYDFDMSCEIPEKRAITQCELWICLLQMVTRSRGRRPDPGHIYLQSGTDQTGCAPRNVPLISNALV